MQECKEQKNKLKQPVKTEKVKARKGFVDKLEKDSK